MSYHPSVYWLFLFISIFLEMLGMGILKYSQAEWPNLGVCVMVALMCLSYFSLSKSILYLPVGVAYAVWEGVGLALIILISVFFFGEAMGPQRALGLVLVFSGSILINKGTDKSPAAETKTPPIETHKAKTSDNMQAQAGEASHE